MTPALHALASGHRVLIEVMLVVAVLVLLVRASLLLWSSLRVTQNLRRTPKPGSEYDAGRIQPPPTVIHWQRYHRNGGRSGERTGHGRH